MDQKTWIIVANAAQARVFNCETINNLVEIKTLIHPESRLHNHELVSDGPGSSFESAGSGQYSMNQAHTPKEIEIKNFAKEVSDFLEFSRNRGEVERLFVAASPAFLGLLRNAMSSPLTQIISKTVDKDITHLKPSEIKDYFFVGV